MDLVAQLPADRWEPARVHLVRPDRMGSIRRSGSQIVRNVARRAAPVRSLHKTMTPIPLRRAIAEAVAIVTVTVGTVLMSFVLSRLATIAAVGGIAVVSIGLSGCATLPPPAVITRDIKIASREATKFCLRQEANARPYFQTALAVLNATLSAQQYDPATLNAALASISVRELRNENIASLLSSALELYAAHFGDVVSGKLPSETIKPILEGLRDGIAEGLQ